MVTIEEIQAAYYMVAATGVLIAAVFYVLNLQAQRRNIKTTLETRQMQLYIQSLHETRTKEFLRDWIELAYHQEYRDYEEWRSKYGPNTNPDAYAKWIHITQLYQGIGYLVERRVIDAETLAGYISPRSFIFLWEKIQPVVRYQREKLDPRAFDSFEMLVGQMNNLLEHRFEAARAKVT